MTAVMPVASTSACHCRRVIAVIMTARPSAVAKSVPNVPKMWLPCFSRSPAGWRASVYQPRLATAASAMSSSATSA